MNSQRFFLFLSLLIFGSVLLSAQGPSRKTTGELHEAAKKLNFLGSVLYVAAHPDDENTSMLAHLANERKAHVAYLSLTRGDGGQNLIGPELAELLGVIRTNELLAARKVDGANQLFARANDFGFSKHPDETLEIWQKDEVLKDVVRAIRIWKPDVVINRFKHDTPGSTHGHHTASAILSYEAFDLAGDANRYPESSREYGAWQPERLYQNTSWWFYGSRAKFNEADKTGFVSVDVGTYYPALGYSNSEMAAISRSQHQCQGMGRELQRGSSMDYLMPLKGSGPQDTTDLFDGINTTWSRVTSSGNVQKAVNQLLKSYNYAEPAQNVSAILAVYRAIDALPDSYWKTIKLAEARELLIHSAGLFVDAHTTKPFAAPGATVGLEIEILQHFSGQKVQVEKITAPNATFDTTLFYGLVANDKLFIEKEYTLSKDAAFSSPFWLLKPWELGMYSVPNEQLANQPTSAPAIMLDVHFNIGGTTVVYPIAARHKVVDPVRGEYYRPFEVLPPVFVNAPDKVLMFPSGKSQPVTIEVRAGQEPVSGSLALDLPQGWTAQPTAQNFTIDLAEATTKITFEVTPPATGGQGTFTAEATIDGIVYPYELVEMDYQHIPHQMVLRPCQGKLVAFELEKVGEKIGYIDGAGDAIPDALRRIGYEVVFLEEGNMNAEELAVYDAIVVGIRAYNTVERIRYYQKALFDYVENGGVMIVQYNTGHRLKLPEEELAPYPLSLSRDRVTKEEAPITKLAPDHAVLNFPHALTDADFDNWVQERGLYFPNEWDKNYVPILEMNDPGEDPKQGALLVAPYGKGHYVYSGLSMFRQLPMGVPGAYRLFVNFIGLGQSEKD